MEQLILNSEYAFVADAVRKGIQSSSVDYLAYNAKVKKAYCVYKSGRSYIYHDVSATAWGKLISGQSIGTGVNKILKPLDYDDVDEVLKTFRKNEFEEFGIFNIDAPVFNVSVLPFVAPDIF